MSEITPEKTYQLLEKLFDYVMTKVPTNTEVNQKIAQVDEKIDKLAGYVMEKIPKIEQKLEKKPIKRI